MRVWNGFECFVSGYAFLNLENSGCSCFRGRFLIRLHLPEQLKGKYSAELDAACGIEGCIFVHAWFPSLKVKKIKKSHLED